MLGSGSSLISKTLKSEILREEALELALEGFLPFTERGEAPKEEKRSLFRVSAFNKRHLSVPISAPKSRPPRQRHLWNCNVYFQTQ